MRTSKRQKKLTKLLQGEDFARVPLVRSGGIDLRLTLARVLYAALLAAAPGAAALGAASHGQTAG